MICYSYGQQEESICRCPKGSTPDTIFYFSNGKAIGLCGYREVDSKSKKISFYEYILFVCGQDSEIASGGWFLQNSKLRMDGDTLILEDCPLLPTGKNFENIETIWTIEKMYLLNGQVKKTETINRNIRIYSNHEIQVVLAEYEKVKYNTIPNDSIMGLADRLFIATISGNKIARKYFTDFMSKIRLDGIYGEEYQDLKDKLSDWDKEKTY